MTELTLDEKERIEAVARHELGEKPITIYTKLEKSRKWFYKWLNRSKTGMKQWYKDCPRTPKYTPNQINDEIEQAVVKIRTELMEGDNDEYRYSFVGAEAIKFHMEKLGCKPSEIPSSSTIKRIIKRNKLRVNKPERYKRVHSKGRYTIIIPKDVDEMHQMDYVGPRHIKGYGPINSIHLKDVVGRQVAGRQYKEKSMDNAMDFLLDYWKQHPIPRYLQVDNGMCFAGDFKHPKSFSRFVRLALYVGIEVVFIAPSKPWMNGTIEEFNKDFARLFWKKEQFVNLDDIREKAPKFFEQQNEFNTWKLKDKNLKSINPKRMLPEDFTIDVNKLPLVPGKIHFIRIVDSNGRIGVLNEYFKVGKEYIGEYVWATIETRKQILTIYYNDEKLQVMEIKKFSYKIPERIYPQKHSIFDNTVGKKSVTYVLNLFASI